MKRRAFIKGTAAAISAPFWLQNCQFLQSTGYPIYLQSDYQSGHQLMASRNWKSNSIVENVQTVIVGGGIAGISAAVGLGHEDFQLFELSNRMGGTSASQQHEQLVFSQGAHYELAYPDYYGEDVLKLFERLNIIKYEPWKKMWSFNDRQHIIPFHRRQQCYQNGEIRPDVIEEGPLKEIFYGVQSEFESEMKLPTRLIDSKFRYLNDQTFFDFLSEKMRIEPSFKRQLDYHMLDDWGGPSDMVSALAGVHYFMCRPYLKQSVDLFSPTNGNAYFLEKIKASLPNSNVHVNHMVRAINKQGDAFDVEVMDFVSQSVRKLKASQVIYAGQKHALKYVYEKESGLFNQTQSPWMVLNFICEGSPDKYGFWQNEFLGENQSFLGFIDSSVQERSKQHGKRIITAYYCLRPEDREYLTTIPEHKEDIAAETYDYISEMLDEKLNVEVCYINLMGHGMSIPVPGFLFNDANDQDPDLIYAGVDNGRLPLLYEAVDSGLMAAQTSINA